MEKEKKKYLMRTTKKIGLHIYVSILDLYCSEEVEIPSHKTNVKITLDQKEMIKATM